MVYCNVYGRKIRRDFKNIKNDGKVLVKDLSIKFNVTEGMIRKDLQF